VNDYNDSLNLVCLVGLGCCLNVFVTVHLKPFDKELQTTCVLSFNQICQSSIRFIAKKIDFVILFLNKILF